MELPAYPTALGIGYELNSQIHYWENKCLARRLTLKAFVGCRDVFSAR